MDKTKVSLNIPNDVHERIVQLAELADMDKTKLMVNILDETTKTLISCKKVGILQFTILMRDLGEKMKEWAENVKKKKVELP